ncbi:MAG: undecaprenyl-diphosphate phosphatase, partial [Patescibacteria group bacterium]
MFLSEIVILGLVQGLTEFLPISSSGHLVLARMLFGISDANGTAFDAFLHLGTLLAVGVYFRQVWWGILRGLFTNDSEGRDKRELAAKLALATVPAAIAGYAFQAMGEETGRSPGLLAAGFLITAALLAATDLVSQRRVTTSRAGFRDAFLIGLAQIAALFPSISRSGVTIAAGRFLSMSRKQATTFSFLMSAPIIAGAGLSSLGALVGANDFSAGQLLFGFLVSFLAGVAAIAFVLKIVEKVDLKLEILNKTS